MADTMVMRNWEEPEKESEEEATLKHRTPKASTGGNGTALLDQLITDGEADLNSVSKTISEDEKLALLKSLITTQLTNYEQIIDYGKKDNQMKEIPPLYSTAAPVNGNMGEDTKKSKHKDNKMREILPLALSTQPGNTSSSSIDATHHGMLEYILAEAFKKPETHGFYCPNCRTCIEKVIVQPKERVRCTSCFSFLIPVASWIFPKWVAKEEHESSDDEGITDPVNPQQGPTPSRDSPAIPASISKPTKGITVPAPVTPQNPTPKPTSDANDPPPHHSLEIPEEEGEATVEGSIIDGQTYTPQTQESGREERKLEILKSIVYGGLVESIASLGIVVSAASSDAKTLNIIALALANLISGLFVLFNNIWELKPSEPARGSNETEAKSRRYQELLGHKDHFVLHASLAILSFLIFGLIPPVVYGFSFQESDNADLKLAVVAAASLLCIILLAIAKAYTNKSNKFLQYFNMVVYYVSTSAVASVGAYLAGKLIKQVLEDLGWFERGQPNAEFALEFPQMSAQNHGWKSY